MHRNNILITSTEIYIRTGIKWEKMAGYVRAVINRWLKEVNKFQRHR